MMKTCIGMNVWLVEKNNKKLRIHIQQHGQKEVNHVYKVIIIQKHAHVVIHLQGTNHAFGMEVVIIWMVFNICILRNAKFVVHI